MHFKKSFSPLSASRTAPRAASSTSGIFTNYTGFLGFEKEKKEMVKTKRYAINMTGKEDGRT